MITCFQLTNFCCLNCNSYKFYFISGNSLYGKTITNQLRHTNVVYCTNETIQRQLNDKRYRTCEELAAGCYEVQTSKRRLTFDLPNIMGFFVYAYAKLRMLQFVYDFMDKFIDERLYQFLQMDTVRSYSWFLLSVGHFWKK